MTKKQEYSEYLIDKNPLTNKSHVSRRNKLALLIFIVLILIGGTILVAYFATGRGWSVAATILDDNVGNMKSYTAIVFNGVGDIPDDKKIEESALIEHQPLQNDLSEGLLSVAQNDELSYNNLGEQIMSVFYRAMAKLQIDASDKIFVSDVRNLYETAGAEVCTIDISNLSYYESPIVLNAGSKKIGIISLKNYTSRGALKKLTTQVIDNNADVVVCIAKSSTLISSFEDINVFISTSKTESKPIDVKDNVYTIEAPYSGEVGIILLTSNNVAVYKSISDL